MYEKVVHCASGLSQLSVSECKQISHKMLFQDSLKNLFVLPHRRRGAPAGFRIPD